MSILTTPAGQVQVVPWTDGWDQQGYEVSYVCGGRVIGYVIDATPTRWVAQDEDHRTVLRSHYPCSQRAIDALITRETRA